MIYKDLYSYYSIIRTLREHSGKKAFSYFFRSFSHTISNPISTANNIALYQFYLLWVIDKVISFSLFYFYNQYFLYNQYNLYNFEANIVFSQNLCHKLK